MSQNQNAAAAETIVSGVNESRFIEHIRLMFSKKDTVIAETMQNARRAEATFIRFEYADDTSTLIITDDGVGILDFSALVTIAESAWTTQVMQTEEPFGIGFSSVSFAAESVSVESRGKMIKFCSEDLIKKCPIKIHTASFIGGTRISLCNCKLEKHRIGEALRKYARGFSLPVYWEDEEMPRPHALENLPTSTTPVGLLHVPGIHNHTQAQKGRFSDYVALYCQGLPMVTGRYATGNPVVVHIDHQKFKPRMPDRDCLVDSSEANTAIAAAINELWRQHLISELSLMPAVEFAATYWEAARHSGNLSIMNTVPFIPGDQLVYISETPVDSSHYEIYSVLAAPVSRADVESGTVLLCSDIDPDETCDGFAKLMFAKAIGYRFFNHELDAGHWAKPFIKSLSDEKAKISGKVIAKDYFSGSFVNAAIRVMETLSVSMAGETVVLDEPVSLGSHYNDNLVILAPKGVTYSGGVLRQASTYINSNDTFCETDLELDESALSNQLAIMNGETGIKTMEKCLELACARDKINLRDSSFLLTFDANGNFTVALA